MAPDVIARRYWQAGKARALIVLACTLVALLICLLVATLFAVDRGWLDRPIADWASRKLDRPVHFARLRTHLLSAAPRLEIDDLVVGSVPWAGRVPLLQIQHLTATLRPLALLKGKLVAPIIRIEGATLRLVRRKDGHNNWTFGSPRPGRAEFAPLRGTESLTIADARLAITDAQRGLRFSGRFAHDPRRLQPFTLKGIAMLDGVPTSVSAVGGSLNGPGIDDPYPFRASLVDGNTKVRAYGTSDQPFDFRRFRIVLDAQGPNVADLGYLFNLRLPNSRPYTVRTVARGEGSRFLFDGIVGRFGDSDLEGWLRSEHRGPSHKAEASFSSDRWTRADIEAALSDLAPHDLARMQSGSVQVRPPSRLLLSAEPFPVRSLLGVDLKARLKIDTLTGYPLPLKRVAVDVDLADGRLTYSSISASLFGGSLNGRARLDVRRALPVLTLVGTLRAVQIAHLVGPHQRETRGLIDVALDLRGAGPSLHDAAASAAGNASVRVRRGTLPPAAAFLVGGDMLRAVGSLGDSDQALTLQCASVSFKGVKGRLNTTSVAVETPAGMTNGSGWIDLGKEQVQLTLLGTPRRKGLFRVSLPILIHGPLRRPAVTALPARNAQMLGLKGKLGVALSPLAALLPMGQQPKRPRRGCP